MPLDAVVGAVLAGLLPEVHRHRQLQLEQDRLERDVELTVVGQPHDRRVEDAVRVVAFQFVGRACASRSKRGAHRSSSAVAGSASGSADSMAWRSSTWRSAKSCRMSDGDHSVTREPRRGSCSTRPCWRKQSQRLSQRRPADAEVGAELLLDDLLAGLQRPAQDGVAQAVFGHFDQRRRQRLPRTVEPWRSHGGQS